MGPSRVWLSVPSQRGAWASRVANARWTTSTAPAKAWKRRAPLSAGQHTIHFGGDFGPGNFALDVTYHITVGNK